MTCSVSPCHRAADDPDLAPPPPFVIHHHPTNTFQNMWDFFQKSKFIFQRSQTEKYLACCWKDLECVKHFSRPAWLLAPSPLPFVLVLLRSVLFCVLLRCPIGKTSNISNCRRPASWCDQEAPDSGGWRWLVTINVFVVFADPPFR